MLAGQFDVIRWVPTPDTLDHIPLLIIGTKEGYHLRGTWKVKLILLSNNIISFVKERLEMQWVLWVN